jgi:hypothetical protein
MCSKGDWAACLCRFEAFCAHVSVCRAATIELVVLPLVGTVQVGAPVREQRLAVYVVLIFSRQAAVQASLLQSRLIIQQRTVSRQRIAKALFIANGCELQASFLPPFNGNWIWMRPI